MTKKKQSKVTLLQEEEVKEKEAEKTNRPGPKKKVREPVTQERNKE